MKQLTALVLLLLACCGAGESRYRVYVPDAAWTPLNCHASPLKGIGTQPNEVMVQDVRGVCAAWWHNWTPQGVDVLGFVPTIQNELEVGRDASTDAGPMLTFNEPNGPKDSGGSDLTPAEAAGLWPAVMAAYPAHDLIAPTVRTQTAAGYPDWRAWLDAWWAALTPEGRARVEGVSCNCYALDTDACRVLVAAVRDWGAAHGVGATWLKEFFDLGLVPWLEAEGIHYAWFVARVPPDREPVSVWSRPLYEGEGMTAWGAAYAWLP